MNGRSQSTSRSSNMQSGARMLGRKRSRDSCLRFQQARQNLSTRGAPTRTRRRLVASHSALSQRSWAQQRSQARSEQLASGSRRSSSISTDHPHASMRNGTGVIFEAITQIINECFHAHCAGQRPPRSLRIHHTRTLSYPSYVLEKVLSTDA